MLFDGWESVGKVVLLGTCTYLMIIAAPRLIGEQALAKMSAYDLVMTIALGSIVATVPLTQGATLTDGVVLVMTYLLLQAGLRKAVKRVGIARRAVKGKPRLVLWDGELRRERMRDLNITESEIRAAVRRAGQPSLANVQAVVLENDGQWSVVPRRDTPDLSAFEDFEELGRAVRTG